MVSRQTVAAINKAKAAKKPAPGVAAKAAVEKVVKPLVKVPKSLAACADLYYELRQERLAADKVAATLKEKESFIREHLINNLSIGDATGAQGKIARATIVKADSYQLKDYEKVFKWAAKNDAPDMFQKRLNMEAVQLRLDAGKKIPGIEKIIIKKISLSKL
jgi:hypothetical protein